VGTRGAIAWQIGMARASRGRAAVKARWKGERGRVALSCHVAKRHAGWLVSRANTGCGGRERGKRRRRKGSGGWSALSRGEASGAMRGGAIGAGGERREEGES
jgi:hypothetical protein